ncbi:hypothetical protein CCACVL1_12636 [Corchorus capsularis]|uniref:Uncharacterized protein n=1 Tax=Corchorus capsularis TaxID=210143 RepID=A0A1R3IEQ8_COCAP|nr:hypothetical protein CCACVL1_12636 [Corchorus capsularis]
MVKIYCIGAGYVGEEHSYQFFLGGICYARVKGSELAIQHRQFLYDDLGIRVQISAAPKTK